MSTSSKPVAKPGVKITLHQACSVVFPVKDAAFIQYVVKRLASRWQHYVDNHKERGVVKLGTKSGIKIFQAVPAEDGVKQICEWAPYVIDLMMKDAKFTIQELDLVMDKSMIDLGANAPQANEKKDK